MKSLEDIEIDQFKNRLLEFFGKINDVDELLKKIYDNEFNLVLVDCKGKNYCLHEPAESDCA